MSKTLHLGVDPGGVSSKLTFEHDRMVTEDSQSTQVTDWIKESVKEAGVSKSRGGMKHVARIPITMYQDWRYQWMGKGKYATRRGDPPCKSVTWHTYLEIKASQYEMAELHTAKISQGSKW